MLDAIRHTKHAVCALFMAGALSACTRSLPPADLTIINSAEPGSLDPATCTGLEELRVCMGLFEGLMRVDPVTARPIPGLAERYEKSPDGLTYTFHLRTNLTWSTGGRITAHDFLWSWLRALHPTNHSEYAGQFFYIKGAHHYHTNEARHPSQVAIHALDDLTLRVELVNPAPFFLDICAFQTLSVVPRHLIEKHGDAWMRIRPLATSGPFTLELWRLNDRIRIRRNPRYWDAANTHSDIIDLLPIRNASTAINLYERGGVDIIWDKELIPSDLYPLLRTNEARRAHFHSFDYLATYFLRFNTTRPPFNDPRVRRALAMSIDKHRLVHRILKTGEPVATQLVPPGTANSLRIDPPPHDTEGARRLLAEAGFPNGAGFRPFEYLFESVTGGAASIHGKIAVELQQMWQRELGLKVDLRQMEKQVQLKAMRSLDYDVARSSWIGDYNDPNTFLDLFRSDNGNNRTGWKNAPYDLLMREADTTLDLSRRATLLREAETILIRHEAPIVPIYYFNGFNYHDPSRVQGIHGNILDIHPMNAIRKIGEPASP